MMELREPWLSQAVNELNESPEENLLKCNTLLQSVKEGHPFLTVNSDPSFLIRFLRVRKFNLERAKKQLIKYYKFRKEEKLLADNRPSKYMHVLDELLGACLPGYDIRNRKVIVLHPAKWNPESFPVWDAFRAAFMLLEVVALDAASQVSGVGVILDLKGFSWRHLAHYDLTLARAIIRTIQDTLPIRFKALYLVNTPSLLTSFIASIKFLLNPKIRKRLHVFNDPSSNDQNSGNSLLHFSYLRDEFGPQILPKTFGGDLDSEPAYLQTKDSILEHENYFCELAKFGFRK